MKRRGRDITAPPRSWERPPKPPYGAVRVYGVRARSGRPSHGDTRMTAMEVRRQQPVAASIARRAVDLALVSKLGVDDGAHHLCRFANDQRAPIEAALRELPGAPGAGPEEECARLLLHRAVVLLASR